MPKSFYKGMFLVHRRDVIEPIEIADRLQIGLVLDQFFGAAVQKANVRVDTLDHFAVQLKNEAQHAVGRRMLRPEVHGVVADLGQSRALGLGVGRGVDLGSHQRGNCASERAGS